MQLPKRSEPGRRAAHIERLGGKLGLKDGQPEQIAIQLQVAPEPPAAHQQGGAAKQHQRYQLLYVPGAPGVAPAMLEYCDTSDWEQYQRALLGEQCQPGERTQRQRVTNIAASCIPPQHQPEHRGA